MSQHKPVGLIGLGRMGRPLAERLLGAGHPLVVFDIVPAAAAGLGPEARVAGSPREVADAAEVVLTCLPTLDSNRDVVLGEDGVHGGRALRTLVCTGTIGVPLAVQIAGILSAANVEFVDCPVTGGVPRAVIGDLTAIMAASVDAAAAVDPLVRTFASRTVLVGENAGDAQRVKLINNLLSASNLALACEAMVLAEKSGLDLPRVLEVVNTGSGQNYATSTKIPEYVIPRNFNRGGNLGGLLKDLQQASLEAEGWGVPMPLHAAVRAAYERAIEEGSPTDDSTSVVKHMERAAGVRREAPGV